MFTNTSLDDPSQFVQGGGMGAGVVEHHHRPVLDVVQPALDGNKPPSNILVHSQNSKLRPYLYSPNFGHIGLWSP